MAYMLLEDVIKVRLNMYNDKDLQRVCLGSVSTLRADTLRSRLVRIAHPQRLSTTFCTTIWPPILEGASPMEPMRFHIQRYLITCHQATRDMDVHPASDATTPLKSS